MYSQKEDTGGFCLPAMCQHASKKDTNTAGERFLTLWVKRIVVNMRKTFQYRIYPTRKQNIILLHVLSVCRHLYNDALHDRKVAYEDCHCGLSYYTQQDWLKFADKQGVYGHILQNVLRRVDKSFQNFFRRVKNGAEKAGYPRFQGRNRYDSFTYPDPYGTGYKIEDGKLHLSKIGAIRIFLHREIVGKIKTCTIKREGDQWYASFSAELPDPEPKELKTSIGVDVGITTLATLSDGTQIENPKTLNKYDSKLRTAQKHLSRRKKGSNNRNKQRIKVARIHRKIRNVRKDILHKASRILADTYDTIVFEDLQIKNMVKNHHLARSIHDASWSTLINFTTYKAEYAGGIVGLVNPRHTSQECSICGNIQSMPLSQRVYVCSACGNTIDRDHNAAINIENRYVRAGCPELTPVEMVA
jgi:putative transposase